MTENLDIKKLHHEFLIDLNELAINFSKKNNINVGEILWLISFFFIASIYDKSPKRPRSFVLDIANTFITGSLDLLYEEKIDA
jgi:hypothetical protein